jgi:hypothetical protein
MTVVGGARSRTGEFSAGRLANLEPRLRPRRLVRHLRPRQRGEGSGSQGTELSPCSRQAGQTHLRQRRCSSDRCARWCFAYALAKRPSCRAAQISAASQTRTVTLHRRRRSRGIRLLLAAEGEGLPEVASRFREAPRASHDDAKRPEPERISPQTPTPQQRDRQCPQRPLERNHPTGLCAAQHALEPPAVPGFVRDACQESPGADRERSARRPCEAFPVPDPRAVGRLSPPQTRQDPRLPLDPILG